VGSRPKRSDGVDGHAPSDDSRSAGQSRLSEEACGLAIIVTRPSSVIGKQSLAEETCRRIYAETREFYKTISRGIEDVGFQILYGAPHVETPILFLGYQPGRGCKSPKDEREYGSEDRWPSECEYATERWSLAKRMQDIFGVDLLKRCVGLNAIFIRSSSIASHRKALATNLNFSAGVPAWTLIPAVS